MRIHVTVRESNHAAPEVYIIDNQPLIATSRPVEEQKELAVVALRQVGLSLSAKDLKFLRRLGCVCGCSPGMRITTPVSSRHEFKTFYVTVK